MAKSSRLAAAASDPPAALRLVQWISRTMPPVVATELTQRFYPFDRACKDGHELPIRSITGSTGTWRVDDFNAYRFALHGCHDWRLLVVGQCVVRPGDMVVEVGANVGAATIGFADLVGPTGRVVAFEPYPRNVDRLRRTLARCGPRVEVVEMAVADITGTLAFVPPDDARFTGLGHLTAEPGDAGVEVRVTTLDDHFDPEVRPVLVAMDVEGAELAVLRGARRVLSRWRPVLVLEADAHHAHRAGTTLYELLCELRFNGYAVRAIGRFGLRRVDVTPEAEPCNWIAVPCERKALLRRISSRILRCGLLPPWAGISPMLKTSHS